MNITQIYVSFPREKHNNILHRASSKLGLKPPLSFSPHSYVLRGSQDQQAPTTALYSSRSLGLEVHVKTKMDVLPVGTPVAFSLCFHLDRKILKFIWKNI